VGIIKEISTMPDRISRKRLKKKVLDRWENEGGRLCDEETKTTQSGTRSLSDDRSTDTDERSSDETRRPFHDK
jgi:hypothetical protein